MISPMRWHSFLFAGLLAMASCLAAAQEQAFTNRATDLMDKGASDARRVASLPENTPVKVTQRSGGWTRIDANGQQGWVRAFHLRFPTTVETSSSSGGGLLGGLTGGLFGSNKPRQATVATTGIRGLSAEDFRNAEPDGAALAKMHTFRVDRNAAERFAREARLASVSVNYLMEEATTPARRR
jgi:hypothetical protein